MQKAEKFQNNLNLTKRKINLKMKKQVENKNIKKKYPNIRFKEFSETWEQCEVGNLFEITRGETLAKKFITNFKTRKNIYPVYSSQTTNNGLMGYYKTYLFENAITWTTDGYAGNFNYRPEKFYSTNVNGVLMSNNGYANYAVSEIINSVAQKYVTKTANPKLMSNVVNQIKFFAPKINEQTKISNLIFTLNKLITLHQEKLDLLKKFKKTLLEKMFSLNEESFPKIRFNGFFDAWEQCQLKEIGKFFSGMSGKSLDDFKTGKDKYITFLNVYQNEVINKKHLENVKANYRDLQVKKNDLFFTISSKSPDDVAMASAWIFDDKNVFLNSFCIGFRIFKIFDIYFLVNNLRSPKIRKQIRTFAKGISRFNVSKKELEKIKLSYCTNIEQEKISNLFLRISNLITLHQKKLKLIQKFKKTLLEKMFV